MKLVVDYGMIRPKDKFPYHLSVQFCNDEFCVIARADAGKSHTDSRNV